MARFLQYCTFVPMAQPAPNTPDAIDVTQLTGPLTGARLPATTLPELVASQQLVLLHFLRHFGCVFCQHSIAKLYALKQRTPRFPTIYFVHQSTVAEGEAFFETRYPGTPHISDPALVLYDFFGIRRMHPAQFLDPRVIAGGTEALLEGYRQGPDAGDVWVLTGTFLFNKGKLIWQHRARYPGDEPK